MVECTECPYGGVKFKSKGPRDSPIVIIGDGISSIDLARKKIFTGAVNELLQKLLDHGGFTSLDVEPLYMNAVECFPRDKSTSDKKVKGKNEKGKLVVVKTIEGGKKKYARALNICYDRMIDEIKEHPRKMIISLGAGALHALTKNTSLKITKERGSILESELAEHGIFVSVHPNFLLKGGGSLRQVQDDFKEAFKVYNGGTLQTFIEPRYTTLRRSSLVRALAKKLKKHNGLVGADIETAGFNHLTDETLEIGLTVTGEYVYIVPGELIIPELFENKCKFIWHNGKFDIKFMWTLNCWAARVDHDTMMLSYVMDELKGLHDLETVSWDWLRAPDYKHEIKKYLPNNKTSYREIPEAPRHKYCASDVARTFQQFNPMHAALVQDKGLTTCYNKILIPGSNYLARVEWNGFKVDREWVIKLKEQMEAEMEEQMLIFQKYAVEHTGKEINTNSPKQLQKFLYNELKLAHPLQKTSHDVLENLPPHPAVDALLIIRKRQKNLSTYINPCLDKVDSEGRVHATFKLHGTVTGRLASAEPNMQNIPRLPSVRGMFIAEEGKILIECDLSQAELRSLAQLSNDTELCRIYNSNELSLHDEVTAEIFPEYTDPLTSEFDRGEFKMRGKAVNFGIVYGRQAFSFMREFVISFTEATRWISKWFDRFPQAATYIGKCRIAVREGKSLKTVFGRKRRFGVITPENMQGLENAASNFPHQSTASDITLLAGIYLEPILRKKYGAKIVNTVHDCIVVEALAIYRDEIARLVTYTMQRIPKDWNFNRVPFISDPKIGERWGHLEELEGINEIEIPDVLEYEENV